MKAIAFVPLFLMVAACTPPAKTDDHAEVSQAPSVTEVVSATDPAQISKCNAAKEAAVAARYVYDKDYRARAGGGDGAGPSLSVDELDACRISENGAFVGKWKGLRWRFIPLEGDSYTRDPKNIWVSDTVANEADRMWHSEWRADSASDLMSKELTLLLAKSEKVEE